ncbi:hypothetical protein M9Y10_039095 [Tritrichomonas musculus]|uniref:Uncharacterized protein n=1 Tax=Tritrichomonas musculus TaxID=1915356 RepID=A0ABR2KDD7_9EUKA
MSSEEGYHSDSGPQKIKAKQIDNKDMFTVPIYQDTTSKYNCVNVIDGKQSLRKTVTALEEIIKIGYMGTHYLLVYITKEDEENDKS